MYIQQSDKGSLCSNIGLIGELTVGLQIYKVHAETKIALKLMGRAYTHICCNKVSIHQKGVPWTDQTNEFKGRERERVPVQS